jgi:hypothetical protein
MNTRVISNKHLIKSLVLFTAMLGLSASAWSEKPTPVTVVNTPGVTVNNAVSHPVPVTGTVSAGPRPSDIINLRSGIGGAPGHCGSGTADHRFVQRFPNGTLADDDFTPPLNKVLVLTSFQYVNQQGPSNPANFILYTAGAGRLLEVPGFESSDSITIPTGIVLPHDIYLCLLTHDTMEISAQGYLADAN